MCVSQALVEVLPGPESRRLSGDSSVEGKMLLTVQTRCTHCSAALKAPLIAVIYAIYSTLPPHLLIKVNVSVQIEKIFSCDYICI